VFACLWSLEYLSVVPQISAVLENKNIIDQAKDFIHETVKPPEKEEKSNMEKAQDKISNAANAAQNQMNNAADTAQNNMEKAGNKLDKAGSQLSSGMKQGAQNAKETMKDDEKKEEGKNLIDMAGQKLQEGANLVGSKAQEAQDFAGQKAMAARQAISDATKPEDKK